MALASTSWSAAEHTLLLLISSAKKTYDIATKAWGETIKTPKKSRYWQALRSKILSKYVLSWNSHKLYGWHKSWINFTHLHHTDLPILIPTAKQNDAKGNNIIIISFVSYMYDKILWLSQVISPPIQITQFLHQVTQGFPRK